jgi:hypothetical protein
MKKKECWDKDRILDTYRDAVGILCSNTLSFCLALLEGVLVLELGTHGCGARDMDKGERKFRLVGQKRSSCS